MAQSRSIPGRHFLHNLIEGRSLIYQLVRRDFKQRYVGSIVGWVWGLIHPLTLLAVYTFVFQYAFGAKLPAEEVTDNYPLFLFAGMLPWLLFAETLQRAAGSVVEQTNLVKKSLFPAEIAPLSVFLSTLVSHLLALALLIVAAALWLKQFSVALLALPIYLALLALLSLGLGWIVAALQVYLRDTAQVLAVALTAWFWLTPIFLSEERYGQLIPGVLKMNPLTYVVRGYRQTILGAQWPDWRDLAVLTAFALAIFVAGGLFFRQTKRGFADVL